MTGEQSWIKQNGEDSNGECWSLHADVAREFGCHLRPFDVYIGPYIDHRRGMIFISSDDGYVGTVCLWPGGNPPAYCEPVTAEFFPLDDSDQAIEATLEVLRRQPEKPENTN